VKFLKLLRPKGPWLLVAIHPDGGKIPGTDRTAVGLTATTPKQVDAFVAQHNGRHNIYYSLNPTKSAMNKKSAKADIAWIEFLFCDLDPKEGERPAKAKARYRTAMEYETLIGTVPAPGVIIDSGNGWQALWPLRKRLPATPENIARVEALNGAIMVLLGGTGETRNIDRILRVPGTTNLPTEAKRKKGRVKCDAELIEFNGNTCTLDDFKVDLDAKANKTGKPLTTIKFDWTKVEPYKDWLKSVDDLPDNAGEKLRTILASDDNLEKL